MGNNLERSESIKIVYSEFFFVRKIMNNEIYEASNNNDFEQIDQHVKVDLKSLRKKFNWENRDERYDFLEQLYDLIGVWNSDEYPDFRDIFRTEEINWLFTEDVRIVNLSHDNDGSIIKFAIKTGYKDEPDVGKDGKPSLLRTTAVHHAAQFKLGDWDDVVSELFKIYDRFDVNYTDESGLTHFHVACMANCKNVVEKFLELGQDPNCLWQKTGDSPLHLALNNTCPEVVELLLKHGADPNLANNDGSTSVHVFKMNWDGAMAKMLFEFSNDKYHPIQIDALDKKGRTPLQLAVANIVPDMICFLLDHGANLSNFIFPKESDFVDEFKMYGTGSEWHHFLKELTSDMFDTVQCLQKIGYEFDQSDVLIIMKIFAKYELFKKSENVDERLCRDEKFVKWAKNEILSSSLSLYDLMQLRPERAEKLFTLQDYLKVRSSGRYQIFGSELWQTCTTHLSEIQFRRFFRRWTLEFFLTLTHCQLPILCCEIIMGKLMNEDLWRICLAATGQSLE
uniref:Uncharacterized protein n=1 Tax=Trichogramma kaykai TaxID=54128 RepID=A0ABD2VYL8_9HYME